MAISKGLLLKVIGGLVGTVGVTGGGIALGNHVRNKKGDLDQGSKDRVGNDKEVADKNINPTSGTGQDAGGGNQEPNVVPGGAGGLPGGSGEKSATDPTPNQISNPQGTAQTVTTGSDPVPVVTNPTGTPDNTVDTGSSSGLQKPKESQTETQSPSSTTTHDSGISSQPQLQQPQLQQQVQEATEKTSTGGEGSGGASQDSTDDVSKTNLGQGGGDTTEGTNSQTKDTDTSDSDGKQGDKASKVEGADAGSKGLEGSNGGAGGANTADGSLGGSANVTGGQKDGGGGADPSVSTKQQPEQVVNGGQTLQSGESASDPQATPSGEPNPTSTTGGSEPGGAGQGTQVQGGTVNQSSQPQVQGNTSTGQQAAVTVPPGSGVGAGSSGAEGTPSTPAVPKATEQSPSSTTGEGQGAGGSGQGTGGSSGSSDQAGWWNSWRDFM